MFIKGNSKVNFKIRQVIKRRIKRGISVLVILSFVLYVIYSLAWISASYSASKELLKILGSRDTRKFVIPEEQTILYEPLKIRNNICRDFGSDVFLLFGVISSPKNFKQRRTMRQTMKKKITKFYENDGLKISIVFFTGIYQDEKIMEQLYRESIVEGDLVIDNFKDSYMNLTLKSLRLLKWTLHSCFNAGFITKLDDDFYVNLDKFVQLLLEVGEDENFLGGHLYKKNEVIRSPFSKWFVSEEIYSHPFYPSYLGGFFYTMGKEALRKMYERSLEKPFYHLEDVFLTGIIGHEMLNLTLTNIPNIVTYWTKSMSLTKPSCDVVEYMGVHQASEEDMKCWSKFTKESTCDSWPIWFC